MRNSSGGASFATILGVVLVGMCLTSLPANADNKDKNWNRGCADAKAGTYDRTKHGDAYEKGWQSCKQSDDAGGEAKAGKQRQADWNRGCEDSKANSYNRANHNADYEAGWQACKSN